MTRTIANVTNRYDKLILAMPRPVRARPAVIRQLIVMAMITELLGRCCQNGLVVRVIRIVSIALKIR